MLFRSKVLDVWSTSRPSLPLASGSQVGGTSSASAGKAPKKQGKLTNPYRLCEGHHSIHLCPYMDEAKRFLDKSTISAPCLLASYKQISLSPSPFDSMIGQESSLVDPAPPEIPIQESVPKKSLDVASVNFIPSMVHQVFSVESGSHIPKVLIVSSDSSDLEKYSPIPIPLEDTPLPPMMEVLEDTPFASMMEVVEDSPSSLITPREDHLSSMVAPLIILVAFFDWGRFAGYRLPSYVPFEITV